MKWFFIFWTAGGISISEPHDNIEDCVRALDKRGSTTTELSGSTVNTGGICFQGVRRDKQ